MGRRVEAKRQPVPDGGWEERTTVGGMGLRWAWARRGRPRLLPHCTSG